ncbi:MAG: hypothetical protein ACI4M5_05015 [Christensenellales bacterium]
MSNRKLVLLLAMVLVVAMVCGLVMGCTPESEGPVEEEEQNGGFVLGGGGSGTGSVKVVANADSLIYFVILSTDNPQSLVNVKNKITNESVVATIVKTGDGQYVVHAPSGGYQMGQTYVIELGKGVTFADKQYEGYNSVQFTITSKVAASMSFVGDFKQFFSEEVISITNVRTEDDVVNNTTYTCGTMVLQTNGKKLSAGEIIIVTNRDDSTKQAYKVVNIILEEGSSTAFNYVLPEIGEVYDEFKYSGQEPLTENSNVTINPAAAIAELEESDVAMALATTYNVKPSFGINVKKEGDKIVATITITVPGVVTLDNGAKTDLILAVKNELSAKSDSVLELMKEDENGKKELNFDVSAIITNKITCTATIAANASFDAVADSESLQDIVDKLSALAAESAESDPLEIPLFKWVLPIANGAAQISYDASLAFRLGFSGALNLETVSTLQYEVGAKYSKENGVDAYANRIKSEDDKPFDSVSIEMKGNATLKVGVIQELGFEVLGGVLAIGLQAELGNYNRLYGYFKTENLLQEDAGAVANLYFEGGFYYDVDLKLGVKIGSLINLADKKVDITAGEIPGYSFGDQELITQINPLASVTFNAFNNVMPTYTMQVYDMKSGATVTKNVPADKAQYKIITNGTNGNYISIDGNIATVNYRSTFNTSTVKIMAYIGDKDINDVDINDATDKAYFTYTNIGYQGAVALAESNYTYDKTDRDNTVVLTVNVGADIAEAPVAKIDGKDYIFEEDNKIGTTVDKGNGVYEITINPYALDVLGNGINDVEVAASAYSVKAKVDVTGKVGYDALPDKVVRNTYYIYTADQINDIIDKSNKSTSSSAAFAGKTFALMNDINMNGAELGQISKFAGELNGNGYKIYNYTITQINGNVAAFIGENTGVITSITFAGDVNVDFKAATGKDYVIAGVVGTNKGTMTNVTFAGNLNVKSSGLQAFINVDVAGVAGKDETTTMTGCDVNDESTIYVEYAFDLANVTFNVGGITSTKADNKVTPTYNCIAGKDGGVFTKVNVAVAK